ncbi:MAG: AAA family ATPase [Bacteroidales bacterium]|jgi:AAA15 family ATPase/GTPase|nr:AAA family ATPase [Bacteroidales bacterium]
MILEIRLSNFFSIKNEIVLDMRAGNSNTQKTQALRANTFTYKDEQILKSVAVYGANASGKSNIIKAIRFCCAMVFSSHNNNENTTFNFSPFKFEGYPHKPSRFFIRFVAGEIEYEYSFSLTRNEIITEELYYYPNGRRAKIFTRDETLGKEKGDIYSFGSVIRKPLDVAENTSRKTLYISRASQMDRDIAKDIFRFFQQKIVFKRPLSDLFVVFEFAQSKNLLLKALTIADSDIVDIKINSFSRDSDFSFHDNKTPIQKLSPSDNLPIFTFHKTDPEISFDFAKEESTGTQALFSMMMMILYSINNNNILFIDEIESSLHSKIVEYIVELFHTSNSAQIIYTTHNTNLLNLNKLRKDQIYFVNKRDDGSSDLYSLFDYKDFRDTMDVEKAYLQGRFDAIPYIDDSLDNLKTLIQ